MSLDTVGLTHFLADNPPTIVPLAIKSHFDALNDQQKLYAHWLSVACFAGTRIVLRQVSPESESIYDLIVGLHWEFNGDWQAVQAKTGVSEVDLNQFLNYAAQFLGNCGNYKSFGDSKFLPRVHASVVEAISKASSYTQELYIQIKDRLYAADQPGLLHLGYPDGGHLSTYYPDSPDITKDEITAVSDFLEAKSILPENTRIRKTREGFQILLASADTDPDTRDSPDSEWDLDGQLLGKKLKLVYGDHSKEMATISRAIKNAEKYALNDNEKKMLREYEKSFTTGSLQAYLDSQRFWIRDKGPIVETDIGFIETYRDPHGIRGEWEGFVAMVNKERTEAFCKLVEAAPGLIPKLPWSSAFEKDQFLSPDFTSLEVLTFAGSGIPAGINIPNYDIIRQNEGFKNVSLGNVLSAKAPNEKIPFIRQSDLQVYQKYRDAAFEVQVGLHELLGHGCGKLLQETSPGQYNFDQSSPPISPLTNKPIETWYKPGQTWSSVFGPIASSYEECRAEAVAMALSCDFGVLQIFRFGDGTQDIDGPAGDLLYTSYLSMARAGILALEFWDPKSRKWGQAHMQARFSILRTFLNAGHDFARLHHSVPDMSDLTIQIDRHKILSHGRPAVEKYLQKLHIYKATANVREATNMYNDITNVDYFFASKIRPLVLANKVPRKVFVQANTSIQENKAVLIEYDATPAGMIQSYAERTYI